jgi:hypothetical protein
MADKPFGEFTSTLQAAEAIHLFMVGSVKAVHRILAGIGIAGSSAESRFSETLRLVRLQCGV